MKKHDQIAKVQIALAFAVRQIRRKSGLTEEQLAKRCKLNRAYISDIERGERNPSLGALFSVASGLNLTVSFLLKETEAQLSASKNEED